MADASAVRSDACGVADLYVPHRISPESRGCVALGSGWSRRWTASFRVDGDEVVSSVRDLASMPVSVCEPVRRFVWRTRQRHRPGLQFMVSTGRHHGFESMAEQRLLLALDFVGVREVVAQPFRLRLGTRDGVREHIPDYLAVSANGTWLFDVRPSERIGAEDEVRFAATSEAALAVGWRYDVVSGWRAQVMATLDTLSAQRRALDDPFDLQSALMEAVDAGQRTFGELTTAMSCPPVARAHLLHLLWHRWLGVDLALPLGDQSVVWSAGRGGGS